MEGDIIKTRCPGKTCNGIETNHVVCKELIYVESFSMGFGEDSVHYKDEENVYQIIRCLGCENISYRQFIRSGDSDNPVLSFEKKYPEYNYQELKAELFEGPLHPKLKRIYEEMIIAYNKDAPTLCAAGIRALIEGICLRLGIEGGPVPKKNQDGSIQENENGPLTHIKPTLEGKIEGLVEKGHLLRKNADILHSLRFMGNRAVHELDKPSFEKLKLAIRIINHFIKDIFDINVLAEKLHTSDIGTEEDFHVEQHYDEDEN